jgi:hypothetical protein
MQTQDDLTDDYLSQFFDTPPPPKKNYYKGTVSQDWDGLFVVLMERALFKDEPLIDFYTYLLLLGF